MAIAALIPMLASVASAAGQVYMSSKANQAQREWNERMYAQQRQDSLSDWFRQNEYNSPKEQMLRFRAAGLNPNLVYGSGATTTAGPVRSTESKSYTPQVPNVSGLGADVVRGMSAYQDWTLQSEQIKNMQAQRDNMRLDGLLKSVTIAGAEVRNAKNSLDLAKAQELYDTSIAQAREELRAIQTTTDVKVSQEVRNAAMHAPNLMSAFERVANIAVNTKLANQQLDNLKKTGVLQAMEINMRKLGLSYNDGVILRMLAQFAGGQSLPEVVKNLWNQLKSLGGPSTDSLDVK